MKNVKLFCVLATVIFITFSNCEESEIPFDNLPSRSTELTDVDMNVLYRLRNGESNKVGLEEATKIANEVIGFLDEESATTRGSYSRRIANVISLKSGNRTQSATKSSGENIELPDTIAYLFNFADSAGYTIIAGDTRIETPILCYTGSGTLGDTIDNPGLAVFMTGVEYYIERSITEAQQQRDSLLAEILAKIDETGVKDTIYVEGNENSTKVITPNNDFRDDDKIRTSYSYGPWTVSSRVGPLLSVEWGQRAPFNAYVPKSCSDHPSGKAPVGCVAVSTSYILTYWFNKKNINFTIDGYSVNSNLLCNYTWNIYSYNGVAPNNIGTSTTPEANLARYQLAHLMERVGSRLNMSYGCKGSGALRTKATSYLRNIGFKGGYKTDYNVNTIFSSLDNGRPVMIRGYSTKNHFLGISWLYSLTDGHSWVLDGYLRRSRQVTVTVTKATAPTNPPLLPIDIDLDYRSIPVTTTTTTTTRTYTEFSPYYIHNNWGNYSNNGYFVAGSYNSANKADLPSSTRSGETDNYQFGVDIFPNIYY